MNLLIMACRYLRFRWLVSLLTVLGIAIGVALVCSVLILRQESQRALSRDANLYDLVAGGKGSPLQLVLSSIYHLDSPTGNLPYSDYQRLKRDPRVDWVVPIGLGDNYAGYRIVGTESHFFDLKSRDGKPFFRFEDGGIFKDSFDVVLGNQVARSTGLSIGDTFAGTHGLVSVPGAEVHSDFPYRVSGILAPTGTAQDRAIFGTLQSVWEIHETEDRLHDAIQGAALLGSNKKRETTAILIRLKSAGLRLWMVDEIRENTDGVATVPINEIMRFQQGVVGPVQRILLIVAGAVVLVSCLTVLITLHQAAERRRRDIAILRSIGASRGEVATLVFTEGLLLTFAGLILGLFIGHGGLAFFSGTFREITGLIVDPWVIPNEELLALILMSLSGAIASLLPALLCYKRTPLQDLHYSS